MSILKVDQITASDGISSPTFPYGFAVNASFTLNGSGEAYFNRSVDNGYLTLSGGTAIHSGGTSGGLILRGSAEATNPSAVEIYSGGASRLTVTSTGIDVTGTVTADGLTVGGTGTGDGVIALKRSSDGLTVGQITVDSAGARLAESTAYSHFDFLTEDTKRGLRISNGDISFYEPTGTTAKFFWDASAERLGLGNTSPAEELHISASQPTIRLDDSDGTNQSTYILHEGGNSIYRTRNNTGSSSLLIQQFNGSTYDNKLAIEAGTGDVLFYDNASTEAMRWDASTQRLGIGTTTVDSLLHLSKSDATAYSATATDGQVGVGPTIYLENPANTNTTVGGQIVFGMRSTEEQARIGATGGTAPALTFGTADAERMRVTSTGDLLVGKTASNSSVVGCELLPSGIGSLTASGNQALYLNRLTSDGAIAEFRKDGTTVGSIGSLTGDLIIGTGDTGLYFGDANDFILPCNITGGAVRDAAIDLGRSATRFKDLYLSGGVYVGGTGAANHLDDYEEGSWTPSLGGTTTYTTQSGRYTKVGNKVLFEGYLHINTIGTGSTHTISGLPFTSNAATSPRGTAAIGYYSGFVASVVGLYPNVNQGTTSLSLYSATGAATSSSLNALFGSNSTVFFTGQYTI